MNSASPFGSFFKLHGSKQNLFIVILYYSWIIKNSCCFPTTKQKNISCENILEYCFNHACCIWYPRMPTVFNCITTNVIRIQLWPSDSKCSISNFFYICHYYYMHNLMTCRIHQFLPKIMMIQYMEPREFVTSLLVLMPRNCRLKLTVKRGKSLWTTLRILTEKPNLITQ